MASSTKTPITNVIPSRLRLLKVNPNQEKHKKVGIIERGIATAAIAVARLSRKNKYTTIIVNKVPSIKFQRVALYIFSVSVTNENICLNLILWFACVICFSLIFTFLATVTSLLPLLRNT